MHTAYALTWEEFAETYEDSLAKTNTLAIVSCLAAAVVFGVVALLLARVLDMRDSKPVFVFFALPLLLVIFSVWEAFFGAKQRKVTKLKEIRSLYDRFYSKDQTAEFADDNWRHETAGKKVETSWAGMLASVERQHVFVLQSKPDVVIVPKRALTEPEIEQLRRLGFPSEHAQRLELRLMDWTIEQSLALWRSNPVVLLACYCVGIAVLIWLIRSLGTPANPTDFFWGKLLCIAVAISVLTAQVWHFPLEHWLNGKGLPRSYEFCGRGLLLQRATSKTFFSWAAFQKTSETRRSFLLYFDSPRYLVLPKKTSGEEQQTLLRKLLNENVRGR